MTEKTGDQEAKPEFVYDPSQWESEDSWGFEFNGGNGT